MSTRKKEDEDLIKDLDDLGLVGRVTMTGLDSENVVRLYITGEEGFDEKQADEEGIVSFQVDTGKEVRLVVLADEKSDPSEEDVENAERHTVVAGELRISYDNPWGFAFPLVSKVAAKAVGLDLVPVKPMSAPSGNLFYMDYRYGEKWYQRIWKNFKMWFRRNIYPRDKPIIFDHNTSDPDAPDDPEPSRKQWMENYIKTYEK